MNSDMADVLRDFLEESRENLDQVDIDLVELETHVRDAAGLAAFFKLLERLELVELR